MLPQWSLTLRTAAAVALICGTLGAAPSGIVLELAVFDIGKTALTDAIAANTRERSYRWHRRSSLHLSARVSSSRLASKASEPAA